MTAAGLTAAGLTAAGLTGASAAPCFVAAAIPELTTGAPAGAANGIAALSIASFSEALINPWFCVKKAITSGSCLLALATSLISCCVSLPPLAVIRAFILSICPPPT